METYTPKVLDKKEIMQLIDKALANVQKNYTESWTKQAGEQLGLPAHAFMNKMSGAMELRNELRAMVDEEVADDDP